CDCVALLKSIAGFDRPREHDSTFTRTCNGVASDRHARLFELTIELRGTCMVVLCEVNLLFEGVLLQEQLSGFQLNEHVTSMDVPSLMHVHTFHASVNFHDNGLKNARQSDRRVRVGRKAGVRGSLEENEQGETDDREHNCRY